MTSLDFILVVKKRGTKVVEVPKLTKTAHMLCQQYKNIAL